MMGVENNRTPYDEITEPFSNHLTSSAIGTLALCITFSFIPTASGNNHLVLALLPVVVIFAYLPCCLIYFISVYPIGEICRYPHADNLVKAIGMSIFAAFLLGFLAIGVTGVKGFIYTSLWLASGIISGSTSLWFMRRQQKNEHNKPVARD